MSSPSIVGFRHRHFKRKKETRRDAGLFWYGHAACYIVAIKCGDIKLDQDTYNTIKFVVRQAEEDVKVRVALLSELRKADISYVIKKIGEVNEQPKHSYQSNASRII